MEATVKLVSSGSDDENAGEGVMFFLGVAIGVSVPLAILAFG
jgi:hypothetical protein